MTARELRIGNYVNNGIEDIIINYVFHEEVSESWQICWDNFCATEFLIDCIPIPLTEEWLLKFGFKQRMGSVSNPTKCYTSKIMDFYFYKNGNTRLFMVRKDFDKNIPIEYVHQLQNLHFALCGEELGLK